jgi:hypothetical protein
MFNHFSRSLLLSVGLFGALTGPAYAQLGQELPRLRIVEVQEAQRGTFIIVSSGLLGRGRVSYSISEVDLNDCDNDGGATIQAILNNEEKRETTHLNPPVVCQQVRTAP